MEIQVKKLSHKMKKQLKYKEKRRQQRQAKAKQQEAQETVAQQLCQQSPSYDEREKQEALQRQRDEYLSDYNHKLWESRNKLLDQEYERRKAIKEQELQEKAEIQKQLEAELEKIGAQEKGAKDAKKALEDQVLEQTEKNIKEGPWHNAIAPSVNQPVASEAAAPCPFFLRTGACRFRDRCSRRHDRPALSRTLLIPSMYSHFAFEFRDDRDTDLGLEYDDSETYQHFVEFYDDVVPEFRNIGTLTQFKVCCNLEPHLRGNVYVQYESENEAAAAFQKFNGRWYAGKILSCEFTNVSDWRTAICGLFHKQRCPKGRNCNFLHVFKNPRNEFWSYGNESERRLSDTERIRERERKHERQRSRRNGSTLRRRRSSDSDDHGRGRRRDRSSYRRRDMRTKSHSRAPEEQGRKKSHKHKKSKKKRRKSASSKSPKSD